MHCYVRPFVCCPTSHVVSLFAMKGADSAMTAAWSLAITKLRGRERQGDRERGRMRGR